MATISNLVTIPTQKQILNNVSDWHRQSISTSVAKSSNAHILEPIECVAISFLNFRKHIRYARPSDPNRNINFTELALKKSGHCKYAAKANEIKNTWSIAESRRLNFGVEIFSCLAMIPSKISVSKPIEIKTIAIILKFSIPAMLKMRIKIPMTSLE